MATATPTRPKKMIAVSKDSKMPVLGHIVWFSVPDEDVSLRRARRLWQLAGLDPKPLPKETSDINAFKRAVRQAEGRVTTDEGHVIETDVRDIPTNDATITYQVSRVVKDRENKVVDYPKALLVWFNKQTNVIDFSPLGEVPRREVLSLMESIQARFEENGKSITGAKVRGLVRSFIKDDDDEQAGMVGLAGENMRGKAGGVYFVLAKFSDQLEGLADFLTELYPNGRAYLYTVPMADGASEREMIRRQHAANSIAEIESAIGEARELLREDRKREVRDNVRSHHFRKLERLRRHAGQYADALQEEQDDLNAHLDVLNRQLRQLLGA